MKLETIDIKKLGINGEGIGYLNNKPIFVDQTLPFEKVTVSVDVETPTFYKGTLQNIMKPARERIKPPCPFFEACGGCDIQHIKYEDGLFYKRVHLIQTLKKYMDNSFDEQKVLPYEASRKVFEYRNKAQLPIRYYKGKNTFGLYKRGTNAFLPIDHCMVHHPLINKVFTTTLELMNNHQILGYDPSTRKGMIKGLMVRVGHETDSIQVVFLKHQNLSIKPIIEGLKHRFSNIVSIYETLSKSEKIQDYMNDTTHCIYGEEAIEAVLNGFRYQLLPNAFFQLNSIIAESFYEYMIHVARIKPSNLILDAYCGAATISHVASRVTSNIYAVDTNTDATHSARASLDKHGIEGVKVITGDAYQVYKTMKLYVDIVFFDPPRVGLGKRMVELLLLKKPKKIVYASCNPSTLAKDLKLLSKTYEVVSIKPFDMFPQTSHVESITLLSLKTA